MNEKQRTITRAISLGGIGIHTGHPVSLTFKPSEANTGIRFIRTDLGAGVEIPALVSSVVEISRGTVLGKNGVKVHTVEHVLAAAAGLGVDNSDY